MKNFKKMLTIFLTTAILPFVAQADYINELKGVMVNVDPLIDAAIENSKRMYRSNQGVSLDEVKNQISNVELDHGLSKLDITKNYSIVVTLQPVKPQQGDQAANISKNVKVVLIPIADSATSNKNVVLTSFYCATNIGPELMYGQEDTLNIRSPLADATLVRHMNNCMYVGEETIDGLITGAYNG